jgi:hypothetical protein
MSDALYQKLFQDNRGVRYTFSTPDDLIPTILMALDICVFPAEEVDKVVLSTIAPGTYPLVYTHHHIEAALPVACEHVPEWIESLRTHVSRSDTSVAFLKYEDFRRFPHMMKVIFPTRKLISRTLNSRMLEYVLDFHDGESWIQVDLCQRPMANNRFAA